MNSAQFSTYDAALAAKFTQAARHSRLVRILRIAVPVTVILAMASIVAVSTFLNPRSIIQSHRLHRGTTGKRSADRGGGELDGCVGLSRRRRCGHIDCQLP